MATRPRARCRAYFPGRNAAAEFQFAMQKVRRLVPLSSRWISDAGWMPTCTAGELLRTRRTAVVFLAIYRASLSSGFPLASSLGQRSFPITERAV